MYNGQDLASALSGLGVSSSLVCEKQTPNFDKYEFVLQNIKDYKKLKNCTLWLSKRLHSNIYLTDAQNGDFCLDFARKTRAVIPFAWAYNRMEQKPLYALVGVDDNNSVISISLEDFVSGLCVGTSGSGKSTFLHSFIQSLAYNSTPKELKFVLVDIKQTELTQYYDLPHLYSAPITDVASADAMLSHLIKEMHRRYKIMKELGLQKLTNELPHILIVVDELAELMLSGVSEIQTSLIRLCQLGRACGIHCLLCTQSPRVAVVNGLIQSNTPSKFALRTSNTRESILALNHGGCEKLLGKGDMIFKRPDSVNEIRVQVPYATAKNIPYRHKT